ncbi:hypothetical protein PUR71_34100 [Streptomyces sp. SP17BM10]|uniref:hypothetical protein n=1 Tax=Streptomyces sp. SP17BM10 TaxID=3002530 RepID=UPI002E76611C|nr:hypothetical protein [Streptomyces sp. SP17BM10]MEE1787902.1 hypothetical protein [Streptomyces sp. SP17BM10]
MTSTASHSATPPHGRPVPGDHGGVPGDGLRRAPEPDGTLPAGPLPEGTLPAGPGPWSVRSVRAGRGRAALEVYEHGELADVLVAARLAPQLLRGARRAAVGGRVSRVLAWGRLAAGGTAPSVVFTGGGWLRGPRTAVAGEVVAVAGRFWLAWAEGPFTGVVVTTAAAGAVAARVERLTLERVRVRAAVGGAA